MAEELVLAEEVEATEAELGSKVKMSTETRCEMHVPNLCLPSALAAVVVAACWQRLILRIGLRSTTCVTCRLR